MRRISGMKSKAIILAIVASVIIGAVYVLASDSTPKSSNTASSSDAKEAQPEPAKDEDTCLKLADMRRYAYKPISKVSKDTQFSRVYFQPDSTAYNPKLTANNEVVGEEEYEFYGKTSSKDYQFTITASTSEASTSESGQQLATARSNKVRDEMLARGIPAERITILPAEHGLAGGDLVRYVYIGVRVPDGCVTQ